MTVHQPTLDRRALLAQTGAAAAIAGLVREGAITASGQTPVAPDEFDDLVAANTTFALDLYRELRQEAEGNLFFSPYSISLALAMTLAGADGETSSQMADVLSFDPQDASVHDAFGALTADLVARGNGVASDVDGTSALHIANALWGEQSYSFDSAFVDALEEHYDAGLESVDFINAPDAAREEINVWVEEQTEGRIQDIVPRGAISNLTRLVLANAIYFSGGWRLHFDEIYSGPEPFYLQDGTSVDVPFMFRTRSYPYAQVEGAQLVELAYAAEGFCMTIILPDEGEIDAFEDGLDGARLREVVDQLASTEVQLRLPRFEFDFDVSLPGILQALGMTDAFDPDTADFSGMVEGDDGQDLFIGDVLHKAFISVDEEGTEAAAATVVTVGTTSAPEPEELIELRIDRPFLFAIRDAETGTVLFLGRVMDPTQGG